MPDRDDRLLDLDDDVDVYEDDWEPAPEERALPPRPRRRLVTPASAALAAVLIGALGFIGGVEVQKGQADSGGGATGGAARRAAPGGASAPGPPARAAGPAAASPARGGAQGNATIGSVANKHGSTLYVKDSDGNTIRVKTTSHSKINRTATASVGAIHPGDTVVVQGTKSSSGTITATQINATSSAAASGLAGLFGGGGGLRGGGSGAAAAAAPQGSGGGRAAAAGARRERRRRSSALRRGQDRRSGVLLAPRPAGRRRPAPTAPRSR